MIRKFLKVMLVLIMTAGIVFSGFNFISIKTNADPETGDWIYLAGKWRCGGDGDKCTIGGHGY